MDPFSSQMLTAHMQILSVGSFQSGQSALLERHESLRRRETLHKTRGSLPGQHGFMRATAARPAGNHTGQGLRGLAFKSHLCSKTSGNRLKHSQLFFCSLNTASNNKGGEPECGHIPI